MEKKELFIDQKKWDDGYDGYCLSSAGVKDPIVMWIKKYIPEGRGRAFEFGCFPGRYLPVFGMLGYELNGIDLTPRVEEHNFVAWLEQIGCQVGQFSLLDARTYPVENKYDIVYSLGLIEHFGDWRGLLRRHAEMVAPGGYLVVSTPNFRGTIQQLLHGWLDQKNMAEHNLDAMSPQEWKKEIEDMGFETIFCGFIGPFDFWVGEGSRTGFQNRALKYIQKIAPVMRRLPDNIGCYAPYCGFVAKRPMS